MKEDILAIFNLQGLGGSSKVLKSGRKALFSIFGRVVRLGVRDAASGADGFMLGASRDGFIMELFLRSGSGWAYGITVISVGPAASRLRK